MKNRVLNTANNANWQLDKWHFVIILRLVLPYIGFMVAVWVCYHYGFSAVDVSIFAFMIVLTGLGFTVGYHRLFAHHSFEVVEPVKVILAILGLMGSHVNITEYVAIHRCHHAFSDQNGDPHSPHQIKNGPLKALRGLWYAHSGWFFSNNLNVQQKVQKYASDLLKDSIIVQLDKLQYLWFVLGLVLPALLGLAITQSWMGALTALILGGFLRVFLQDQIEFWGRGLTHYFGSSPLKAEGNSTNNWIAFITLGEWHNNHHAFPHSAKHGFEPWQLDVSYFVIATLEKLGLASKVKRISPEEIKAKRVKI
jgi:stearoyl-CoA desaturase (delta-9 desaturase)